MTTNSPTIKQRLAFICFILVSIPLTLTGTLALKARLSDGPSVIFSGGPLVSGDMVTGPEPDCNARQWRGRKRRRMMVEGGGLQQSIIVRAAAALHSHTDSSYY